MIRRAALFLLIASGTAAATNAPTLASDLEALGFDAFVATFILAGFGGIITTVGKSSSPLPGGEFKDSIKDILSSTGAGLATFLLGEHFKFDHTLEGFLIFMSGLSGALTLNIYRDGAAAVFRKFFPPKVTPP